MKRIVLVFIALVLLFLIMKMSQIQKYIYLNSDHFHNDMWSLEFSVFSYYDVHKKFPSNFEDFLPNGERLFQENHPKEPSSNFYKSNIEFHTTSDTLLVIYMYGFDKNDDRLSSVKYVDDIMWLDLFTFKGDIIVDTLVRSSSIKEHFPKYPPPGKFDIE